MDAGTQTDNSGARPWRRLSDLLLEIDFMEVQLEELQHLAPAHQTRNLGRRIAACHSRLDELERRVRLHAEELGEGGRQATISELRQRLARLADRRRDAEHGYRGPERRRGRRRRDLKVASR